MTSHTLKIPKWDAWPRSPAHLQDPWREIVVFDATAQGLYVDEKERTLEDLKRIIRRESN
jgi:hypothetical protein